MPPIPLLKTFVSARGVSIISVVISSAIVVTAIVLAQTGNRGIHQVQQHSQERLMANGYATELLELLSSYSTNDLVDYLKTNPAGGASPYPFCAHINILNRATNKIYNRNPIAELPANPLDGPKGKANRFFQVRVVDIKTLAVKNNPYCAQNATTMTPLTSDDRLLVTVGVSWLPKTGKTGVQRVALSTVLPK